MPILRGCISLSDKASSLLVKRNDRGAPPREAAHLSMRAALPGQQPLSAVIAFGLAPWAL